VSSGLLIWSNLLFLVLDFVFPVLLFVVRRKERGQARPAAGAGLCAGSSSRRLARERGVLQARALGAQGSQASRGPGRRTRAASAGVGGRPRGRSSGVAGAQPAGSRRRACRPCRERGRRERSRSQQRRAFPNNDAFLTSWLVSPWRRLSSPSMACRY